VGSNPTLTAILESISYRRISFLSSRIGRSCLGVVRQLASIAVVDAIAKPDIQEISFRASGLHRALRDQDDQRSNGRFDLGAPTLQGTRIMDLMDEIAKRSQMYRSARLR